MIYAIDCDLRKVYCVGDTGVVVANGCPITEIQHAFRAYPSDDPVLFEIASPVTYDGRAKFASNRAWLIYNATCAGILASLSHCPVLVAPSHVWTRGYDLKIRHALAKATAKNKDLRECQAMIWMYKQRPQDWVSLPSYLASL